jgi:hypothetical protein
VSENSRVDHGLGWIENILSAGGKEVLIKSDAQEIPVYSLAPSPGSYYSKCTHLKGSLLSKL